MDDEQTSPDRSENKGPGLGSPTGHPAGDEREPGPDEGRVADPREPRLQDDDQVEAPYAPPPWVSQPEATRPPADPAGAPLDLAAYLEDLQRLVRSLPDPVEGRHAPPAPEPPSAPAPTPVEPAPSSATDVLRAAVSAWRAGEAYLGRRLMLLGEGPVPIVGAHGGAVGIDEEGRTVVVLAFGSVPADAAAGIADHLDRIAQLRDSSLSELEVDPTSDDPIPRRHAAFFGVPETERPLNHSQVAVLLVESPPGNRVWKALVVELSDLLEGIYDCRNEPPQRLEVPATLTRRSPSPAGWSVASWIALAAVLLGVGIAIVGIARALDEPAPRDAGTVQSPIRDVASGVATDATMTQWIGQEHAVRTRQGRLILLYATPDGLQLVSDESNQGRSWRTPVSIPDLDVASFSAAIDDRNDIHLVMSDGSGISYAELRAARGEGWVVGEPLELDAETGSLVTDVAWDETKRSVHAAWVGQEDGIETIEWAAIDPSRGNAEVIDSSELDAGGTLQTALLTLATDPEDGDVLVTYRSSRTIEGWFARIAQPADDRWAWGPEETLRTDAPIGAASAIFDARGRAHLVLRDNTGATLLYQKRSDRGGWTAPEIVVDAETIEGVDFPTIAVDRSSELIYLFFHSNETHPETEVRLSIRDPATGWEGPYGVAPPETIPEGAAFPMTISATHGQAIVFWTKKGAVSTIQAARVTAP